MEKTQVKTQRRRKDKPKWAGKENKREKRRAGEKTIWKILGIITAVLLIVFWRRRSAVWGGLTLGVIIGFIVAIFFVFKGSGFNWDIIWKGAIIGTILGFIAELIGMAADFIKKREEDNNKERW